MTPRKKSHQPRRSEQQQVLQVFKRAKHPLLLKELKALMAVPAAESRNLQKIVHNLVKAGELIKLPRGRYGLTAGMNLVAGQLSVHPEGYGFVASETGGPDVFINPANLKEALHGDRVVARVEHVGHRGRREGRIIRILERRIKKVVGLLSQAKDTYFVSPEDEHLLFDLIIPAECLDQAQVGQVVVAEITRFPTERLNPLGKIIEVLGAPEDPLVQVKSVIHKYDLPRRFPTRVLREARQVPREVPAAARAGRLDLRELLTVTIDGDKARDFDDGVALVKKADGSFILYVSIADVSYYVNPGSALDAEAYQRGNSIYFPHLVLPMLPEELSNGICSLNPGVERLAVTVTLNYNAQGRLLSSRFNRSVVQSQARLTYNQVQEILESHDLAWVQYNPELVEMLTSMAELCQLLRDRRKERGSLLLSIPEAEVRLDDQGVPTDIRRIDHLQAHQLIEEFMIAANEAAARCLGEPAIFRVHDVPDPDKMQAFRRAMSRLGYRLPPEADYNPLILREFFDQIQDTPVAYLVQIMLLRSLKQARYAASNVGHYGLAAPIYTHFTSPIRRYPDLMVHRLLLDRLQKTGPSEGPDEEELADQARFLSARERLAIEAEREMLARMQVRCLAEHVGEIFHGTISGVSAFGFFVSLDEIFAEGLVRLVDLPDDYYKFQESRLRLIGRRRGRSFQVGDRVQVRVAHVDLRRRHINLVLCPQKDA
ncbi:MAG: ribonuclease R [Deltaproteobacteria bacterium]|nr:ribonuclease R [Deltaproteobacteria bacterium]